MAENSKIEWCDHTFNPWIGCTKVSPGCQHCYAEALMDTRLGKVAWGPGNPRQRTSEANWKQVERWNRTAADKYAEWEYAMECRDSGATEENMPYRPRVFVASLADWLDPEVPIEWLADLLDLIRRCPHLDFLMLTKRPELWRVRMDDVREWVECTNPCNNGIEADEKFCEWLSRWDNAWYGNDKGPIPSNTWIGTSVDDQQRADERIPALLKIPARVRFLSCEPLLGPVEFSDVTHRADAVEQLGRKALDGIHWVIAGGESGPNARPMHPDWARSLRNQCQEAGVPFFFKQWGEWLPLAQKTPVGWYKAKDYFRVSFNRVNWLQGGVKELGTDDWIKVGKAKAGRLLDGREWNEFPTTTEKATL